MSASLRPVPPTRTRAAVRSALIVPLATLPLALAGCFPLGALLDDPATPTEPTVTADELATTAEGLVLEQSGFTVEIDCGSGEYPLLVGTALECDAVDVASGATGAYTLTITEVNGSDYRLDVVGSEAGGDVDPGTDTGTVTIGADEFAVTVTSALTDIFGETPDVVCGNGDVLIEVGQEVTCLYTVSSGSGEALATITAFDGSTYSIDVEVVS